MASKKMIMLVLALVLMSWTTTTLTQAQVAPTSGPGTCLQVLIPCQRFLSSKTPPAACCDPLKKAVETDLPCLCAAFTNPALGATINMTQAMMLPVNCGIKNAGPSMCIPGAPTSSPAGPSTSTPSTTTPTSTTSSPPPKGNGAGRSIALAGPVSGLMLLVTGLMFY